MDIVAVNDFKAKISKAQSVVIIPHHNPDGDALGSALGLYNVLSSLGINTSVVSPNGFPTFLDWMPGAGEIVNFEQNQSQVQKLLKDSDLVVIVDFNSSKRVKGLGPILDECTAYKIMVDHHPFPDEEAARLIISDTRVSSTCELMYTLLVEAGFAESINRDAASCFYTGIITDTGILSHNSSRPETYLAVAGLVSKGIDKDEIHKRVYHSNSLNRMQLLGYCLLEKLKLVKDCEAAYISLSKEELDRFHFEAGDTEGFVNYPLGIEGINISALFMEQEGRIKVSLRSRGDFAVNLLSEQLFNGGGHHNAAGGESFSGLNKTVDAFVQALPIYLKKKQNN